MATADCGTCININPRLFHELKEKYPEVPDSIVRSQMEQYKNDKSKCIEVLANESPKYLYGPSRSTENCDETLSKLQDLNVARKRNNSGGTFGISSINCSTNCTSTSPPSRNSTPHHNSPGSVGEWISQSTTVEPQIPISPTALNAYVPGSNVAGQIPNIDCNTFSQKTNGDITGCGDNLHISSPVRHPVQVVHCQQQNSHDTMPNNQTSTSNEQASYVYRIQFPTFSTAGHQETQQNPVLHVNSGGGQIANRNFLPQVHPSPNPQNHSSQATIFLRPNNLSSNFDSSGRLAGRNSPQVPYMSTQSQPGYHGQPLTPQSVQYRSVSPSPLNPVASCVHNNTQNYTKPLFVEITSSGPEGSSSHLRYNSVGYPEFSSDANNSNSPGASGSFCSNHVPCGPPSGTYGNRTYPRQLSNINPSTTGGFTETGCFLRRRPPMVHSISSASSRSASLDSEHEHLLMTSDSEVNHIVQPLQPILSTDPSHMITSETPCELPRSRSGSLQDDPAYTSVLLRHQETQRDKLKQDLQFETTRLINLRKEVADMERNLLGTRMSRSNSFPSIDDITSLRETNRSLQTDLQCMTREIDVYNNGQTPLGVLDPMEQQNFFRNMNPGQRGSIYSSRDKDNREREKALTPPPPPLPPRKSTHNPTALNTVPPPPPAQPSTGSGDSEEDRWSCQACTFLNHPALNKCECCEMDRRTIGRNKCSMGELCYCHDH